jgi:hypothetical protein
MIPYDQVGPVGVQANIEYYTALEQQYEQLAKEARAERARWRSQLAPARHRAKVAAAADQVKRPRGRPVNPNALSGPERLKRMRERRAQRELEALLGNTKP